MMEAMDRYDSIGHAERALIMDAMRAPLSGYLAGNARGGYYVRSLETLWADTFGVKHAIACNSATSGLLAASFAIGLKAGDHFVVPTMTMSATAAAPMFTGALPHFVDVEDETFGLVCGAMPDTMKAIFSVNLFGHPSQLGTVEWAKNCGYYLIEDNSQSPFAMAHGRHCGTMGHIGVWSLNVHKHIQCGEGGVVTTDDDSLARDLRDFINHGENAGGSIGLNLRMPELCAAVALSQLRRNRSIVQDRIEQAEAIIAAIGEIPGIRPPVVRAGCTHVYYTIPFLINRPLRVGNGDSDVNSVALLPRSQFCAELRAAGVPIIEGYQQPLHELPAFRKYARACPVAKDLHDSRLFYFENCAWSPTKAQIKLIGDAFKKAAEAL